MPGFGRADAGTSNASGQGGGYNPATDKSRKRDRDRQRQALGIGGAVGVTGRGNQDDTPGRILAIERASGSTLPSRLVLGLAQSNTDAEELHRASMLVARMLDISPQYMFTPAGDTPMQGYIDPVTGQTISLETARRIIKPFEPKIISSMLGHVLDQPTPTETVRMGPNGEPVQTLAPGMRSQKLTASRIAKAFVALAPIDGQTVDFGQAAAVALSLARSKLNLETFTRNLQIALQARGLTPLQAAKAAELGAQNGLEFHSIDDLARIVLPTEAAQNIAGARARAANVAAIRNAGGYLAYENEQAAEKNAAIQAAAQGAPTPQPQAAHGLPVSTMGVSLSAGLLDALQNGEGDYNVESKKIISEMKASQNVFADSWVYKYVFHPAGYAINKLSGATDVLGFAASQLAEHEPLVPLLARVPGHIATGAHGEDVTVGRELAEIASFGLYDPVHASNQQSFSDLLHNDWETARDLFYQRNTFGDWFAGEAGMPRWTGSIIELASQFAMSPDSIALRVLSDYRAGKLISAGDTFVTNARRFVYGPMRHLVPGNVPLIRRIPAILPSGRLSFAENLARTLDESKNSEQAFARQVDMARTFFTSDGLDARTVAGMWEYAHSAKAAGASTEDITKGIQFFLARSMGLAGTEAPTGTLARYVEQYHRDLQTLADNTLPASLLDPAGYTDAEKTAASEAERALGIVDQWDQYTMAHGPIQLEVPHAIGVQRRMLSSLRANEFIGESKTWRNVSALFNETPAIRGGKLLVSTEENPADDLVSVMKRTRVFSQQEVASARLEMSTAASPINATRELSIGNVIEKYQNLAKDRIFGQNGMTREMGDELMKHSGGMFEAKRVNNVFGAETVSDDAGNVVGSTAITKPLLPSQLPNAYEFVDPVWLRRGISESMGAMRRMRNGVLRAVHAGVPEARLAHTIRGYPLTLPKLFHDSIELVVRDLFLNLWKPLVVLRPAYITRVVGIEEQARFLSTMGFMSRLESGKVGARVLNLTDRIGGDSRYITYPFTRVDEEGNTISDLFRFERRPGRLTNDALAANTQAKLAFPGSDALSRRILDYLNSKRWTTLSRDDPQYYDAWAHDLVNQAGKDPVGRIYLQGLRDGKSDDAIINDTLEYLHTDLGKKEATRLMGPNWTEDDLRSTVERGTRIFRSYAPKPDVAQAALDGTLTAQHLRAVPIGSQPAFIHGPELESVLSREGVFKKIVNTVHKSILQAPTNALSRQPYFKAWYSRMTKASLDLAEASGRPLTEELIKNIEAEARRFALGQVSRIMFDFTRQNRLGELANWLIPFFQPYSEGFTVWSRILSTNPQIASYVTRLYNVGKESGFIHKDPTTGEDTISLDWWAKALSWATLGHFALPAGFHASAPLNSINFFFQAALPIPTGGFAGDVPIPLPGFNPEALSILQKVVDHGNVGPWKIPDGARARMSSYLFQYGTVTGSSLLPTWLRHALTGAGLVGGNPDELNSTATEFLRLYEQLGMSPSTTKPVPGMSRTTFFNHTPEDRIGLWKSYLSKLATEQAGHLESVRAMAAAFFPASPRITSPVEGAEQDLVELRKKYGYQKGTDYFLAKTPTGIPYVDSRRHPDLALVTISKSIWTGGEAGSTAPGAGSPVSIPANPYVNQLLKTKGAKKFAQKYPEWLWAIIPSELRDSEFDQSTYFDQIGSGLRDVLNPMDYLSKAEQQKGWDAYFAIRTSWNNWQETHPDLTEGTDSYVAAQAQIYSDPIDQLKRENPDWASEFGNFNTQGVDANVMAHARSLVKQPAFLKTDAGAGLKQYLDLRDEIRQQMLQQNVTTITTKAAGDAGLTDQYNEGVKQIELEHPDFKTAYDFFFANDLQGLPTYRERVLDKAPPAVVVSINQWDSDYKAAQAAIDTATDPLARSQAFIDLRAVEDRAISDFSPQYNPEVLKWKSLTPEEQSAERQTLMSKPYAFLTQFERTTILGEPTNTAAEQVWFQYDEALLEIQKYERANPAAPVGPLYDQINTQLATLASKNPTLSIQLQHANDWTYLPKTIVPGARDPSDPANAYWTSFLDAVHTVEVTAVKGDLHGLSSGTAEQQQWWGQMQQAISDYRDQLFQSSPIFQREYLQAEKDSPSDTLIENLVPDTFYPVGGAGYVAP